MAIMGLLSEKAPRLTAELGGEEMKGDKIQRSLREMQGRRGIGTRYSAYEMYI